MFGIEKKVERVRVALVKALQAKSIEIMMKYADKKPEEIPRHDLARSMVLHDLAEILTNLRVVKHPEDDVDDKQ
jgi:hypothetical protein